MQTASRQPKSGCCAPTAHRATSAWPPPQAHMRGFEPKTESLSSSPAPASTRSFATPSFPPPHATIRGVQSSIVRAATLAGGDISMRRSLAIDTSPVAHATISGVRPVGSWELGTRTNRVPRRVVPCAAPGLPRSGAVRADFARFVLKTTRYPALHESGKPPPIFPLDAPPPSPDGDSSVSV